MAFDSASEIGGQPTGTIAMSIFIFVCSPGVWTVASPSVGSPNSKRMIDRRLDQRPSQLSPVRKVGPKQYFSLTADSKSPSW